MKTKLNFKINELRVTPQKALSWIAVMTVVLIFAYSCKKEDEQPDVTITAISPTSGGIRTSVEITGTGFVATAAGNSVTLNGKVCPVVSSSTTKITITIPDDGETGTFEVTVGKKSARTGTFTVIPLTVTSISPTSGSVGTSVEINGAGFSATPSENAVTLNGKVCQVTNASATKLTVIIPTDAATGNLTVTVNAKSTQSGTFTVVPNTPPLTITSIAPTTGPINTPVTITGTGFSTTISENVVNLTGKVCTVTSATATTLMITIPADAGTGNISVTVRGVTAQSGIFTFIPLSITSISPTSGPKNTPVTITGTGFSTTLANNVVKINDKICVVSNATETQLSLTIPTGAGSGVLKVTKDGKTVESQIFDFVFTTTVSTFAGSGEGSDDGTGVAAKFKKPFDIVFDASDNLYVTDGDNHKIRKINTAGAVSTFAGSSYGFTDGPANTAQFQFIKGIAIDANRNLYVADENSQRIRKITQAGVVSTLAGDGSEGSTENTVGTSAQFRYPTGVAVDGSGNVYVADKDNHRIRKISTGGAVSTFAGSNEGSTDGNGTSAQFKKPFDAVFDASGNMYVTDGDNHKIRRITPSGAVSTFAGSTYGYEDGPGTTAKFQFIKGIAIDRNGNLYVADENSHRIRKVTPAGVVSTLAGTGSEGFVDGPGASAQFNYPTGVAVDGNGNVYVADKDNHKIRKITID